MKKSFSLLCLFGAFVLFLISCSGNVQNSSSTAKESADPSTKEPANSVESPKPPEPVTIEFANHITMLSEADFQKYVSEPVRKKYPHITVKQVDVSQKGQDYPELVLANHIPDIITGYLTSLTQFDSLGLTMNMEDLIKKHNFDLNRIQPEFLNSTKVATDAKYLTGLPIYNNAYAISYNKNLLDRFGVPYPKDGMTWDQMLETAVKLTRVESGTQYYGLFPDAVYRGASQLSLPYIDTRNDKAVFQTEGWKQLFVMWSGLYKSQGINKAINFNKAFTDGQIAMRSETSTLIVDLLKLKDFDWDVVTYPNNPKVPGFGQRVANADLLITSQSKHKDEAFQVISVILSDEVQADMSRNLRMSVLNDRKIQDQFGQANSALQAKNVVAFTKLKLAPFQTFKYDMTPDPANLIQLKFNDVIYKGEDINTALREADDQMNQAINEVKK